MSKVSKEMQRFPLLALCMLCALCVFLAGCRAQERVGLIDPLPELTPDREEFEEPDESDVIDALEETRRISDEAPGEELPESDAELTDVPEINSLAEPAVPTARDGSALLTARDDAASEPELSEPAVSDTDEPIAPQVSARAASRNATLRESESTTIESELLRLINQERQTNGLSALVVEDAMQFAASIRAQEALVSLSHTRPEGEPYHTAFDEAGFSYAGKWHGENLAVIQLSGADFLETDIAAALFREWKGSPGHQQNMLGEHFAQTGVAVHIQEEDGQISVGAVQLFASV